MPKAERALDKFNLEQIFLRDRFRDVAHYNEAETRHPLPDPSSPGQWHKHYTGHEAATALPAGLRENVARNFIISLGHFEDYIRHGSRNRSTPYGRLQAAMFDENYDPIARKEAFSIIEGKTIGNLCTFRGSLCRYLVGFVVPESRTIEELKRRLSLLGIETDPPHPRQGVKSTVYYKPSRKTETASMAHAISSVPGASYLDFMMTWFNGAKPQYTQPTMYYIGDALEKAQTLLPELDSDIEEIKQAYKKTGLEDAVRALSSLGHHGPKLELCPR